MSTSALRALAWALILIQGGHVAEHVVQTGQIFVLDLPKKHAHGLLGAVFDFEWVHFTYNTAFLGALFAAFRIRGPLMRERARGPVWSLFVAGLVLQGYHEVEHVVKMYQHVTLGQTPAPGILGNLVDLVFLHLTFNLVVYAMVLPLLAQTVTWHSGSFRAPRARPARRSASADE